MNAYGHVDGQEFLLTVEQDLIQSATGPGGVEVASRLAAAAGSRVEVPTVGTLRVRTGDPASTLAWLNTQPDIQLDTVTDPPVLAPPVPEGTTP